LQSLVVNERTSCQWSRVPNCGRYRRTIRSVILRCTKKLLAVVGSALVEPAPAPDDEDWYANLLWFDRRKCLLLTHVGTLFTIFEANLTAAGLRSTGQLVTGLIDRELHREGLPPATFGDLEQQEVLLAKTADRSVLGCMNDMAFLCEHTIGQQGGLSHADLADLNRWLRRNISSARGYCPPIELAAAKAAGAGLGWARARVIAQPCRTPPDKRS